eukprot:TRINITY_DN8517_c0_g1_i5.p1 TRINITY_DN8517_c0_g1~~TRINITY_DN8517_c0_g1_i5.p1  ORF type:complete len:212 (-),score=16.87 TRINITY_DN8517_c0_g1_i5:146-781(-)
MNKEALAIASKEGLQLKVFLYVPNIIGYLRLACFFVAFYHFKTNHIVFLVFYALSHILDAFDGMAARKLNQCSKFGAMLDMIVDRMATISLMMSLGSIYPHLYFYFLLMALIDMVSHWYQMYSYFLLTDSKECVVRRGYAQSWSRRRKLLNPSLLQVEGVDGDMHSGSGVLYVHNVCMALCQELVHAASRKNLVHTLVPDIPLQTGCVECL